MARVTRLGLYGGPRPLYGSFSKGGGGPHPVGHITRLGLYGGPRPRYGSFVKVVGTHPVGHITRLGLYGGPRPRYGTFAGKTASDEPDIGLFRGPNPWISSQMMGI